MSGFIVRTAANGAFAENGSSSTDTSALAFIKKGMKLALSIQGAGYVIQLFSNATHDPAQVMARDESGRFCTYVGTLIYKGCTASSATGLLLEDIRHHGLACLDQALGNYCFLVNDDQGLRILTDRAGLHHVYCSDDLSFVSNSFISAACSLKTRRLRTQEILEYVMFGATFGDHTLLEGVKLLGQEVVVRIQGEPQSALDARASGMAMETDGSMQQLPTRFRKRSNAPTRTTANCPVLSEAM
jgi:hypothetical protein